MQRLEFEKERERYALYKFLLQEISARFSSNRRETRPTLYLSADV